MEDQNKPKQEPQKPTPPDEVGILHLSDLHAGRGFQESRWNDLLGRLGVEVVPRVVILSGDLVNSPTRSEFQRAKQRIGELREKCPNAEFVVLPGNHDTRIWGILRVPQVRRWLLAIVALFLVVAGLAFRKGWNDVALVAAGLAVIGAILFLIALAYYVSFQAHFPPQGPVLNFDHLGLDLLLFDSASDLSAHWAEGVVNSNNFVAVKTALQRKWSRNFRIAVLHHHALPIPHEAGDEPMMVLKNAGAFLSEVSGCKVALVLHGHRHSPSFSRISVNADKQPFQIGVLSTGSVTSGDRDAARLGHSFSVIGVNRWGNARITRYQSDKGALFVAQDPFMARSIGVATSECFAQNALVEGCSCESVRVNIELTPDGDAKNRIDHVGFTVKRDLTELPH